MSELQPKREEGEAYLERLAEIIDLANREEGEAYVERIAQFIDLAGEASAEGDASLRA